MLIIFDSISDGLRTTACTLFTWFTKNVCQQKCKNYYVRLIKYDRICLVFKLSFQ